MEVVITMMITGILTGITYSSYQIVHKSYRAFKKKNDETASLEKLDELLKKDFNKAEMIKKTGDDLIFFRGKDTVTYGFAPGWIIRRSVIADTFKILNQGPDFNFEGHDVEADRIEEDSRVDDLVMPLFLRGDTILLRYHKIYSSVNLYNENTHAIDRP